MDHAESLKTDLFAEKGQAKQRKQKLWQPLPCPKSKVILVNLAFYTDQKDPPLSIFT